MRLTNASNYQNFTNFKNIIKEITNTTTTRNRNIFDSLKHILCMSLKKKAQKKLIYKLQSKKDNISLFKLPFFHDKMLTYMEVKLSISPEISSHE